MSTCPAPKTILQSNRTSGTFCLDIIIYVQEQLLLYRAPNILTIITYMLQLSYQKALVGFKYKVYLKMESYLLLYVNKQIK